MSLAADPSATWDMLTAIGTLALAAVTAISTGMAVWLPRFEARRQQRRADERDRHKCGVANMQLKEWSEQSDNGRIRPRGLADVVPDQACDGKAGKHARRTRRYSP